MRRGQRPSRHTRRVQTRRGATRRLINPSIARRPRRRRFRFLSRTTGTPMKPARATIQELLQWGRRSAEHEAAKAADRLDDLRVAKRNEQVRQATVAEERRRDDALRQRATKDRLHAYDDLVVATTDEVRKAQNATKVVLKQRNALTRMETALTPFTTETYAPELQEVVPTKQNREGQVHHALDLAIKTRRPDLIQQARDTLITLDTQLAKDTNRAKAQRTTLLQHRGAETYRRLQGKIAKGDPVTQDELLTVKMLDPNTFTKGGPFEKPGDWAFDHSQGEYVARKKIMDDLVKGEWQHVTLDPASIQGQSTDVLLKQLTALTRAQQAAGLHAKHLMEQDARERIGLSHRGEKTAKRSQREAPTTNLKLIFDDAEGP